MVLHARRHDCDIRDYLKEQGLMRSKDRQSLLMCFQEHRTWSPAQLIHELPETAKGTVYRNLELFLEKEIITQAHVHDGVVHYELNRGDHHDHLTCVVCHVISCVDCIVPTVPDHILELTGRCETCV